MNKRAVLIGTGGFARCGKDTFVKVARKILSENGYTSERLAFADELKNEIDLFLKQYYGISAWTNDNEEKKLIRPFLVAHGCGKRIQTDGRYWIDKIDEALSTSTVDVNFISDCRFPNEVDWIHNKWNGWFVHLKKYTIVKREHWDVDKSTDKIIVTPLDGYNKFFDVAPNSEEAENDPICEKKSDYKLELENVIDREFRLNGNKITTDDVLDNTYLYNEIKLCLTKCPFLTIK